jgi:hypothetical protein
VSWSFGYCGVALCTRADVARGGQGFLRVSIDSRFAQERSGSSAQARRDLQRIERRTLANLIADGEEA